MSMIRERKEKIYSDYEKQQDTKMLRRMEEIDRVRKQNEKLQIRADIKAGLKAEKQKRSDLKYGGIKSALGSLGENLNKMKVNKAKTGVLFGGGRKGKKKAENRFSNEGVFYSK